ncbi:MAG: metal-dependent transcriptional regulator [Bacteroidota bacterium]
MTINLSLTEENYLKAIFHLSQDVEEVVSTNAIADHLDTKPASVSDMIRKLSNKSLIDYEKYQGVTISDTGRKLALQIVRKHRLWEVFLVDHLKFNWDEVHEVAEQLEHIQSPLLIKRLDEFLGFPKQDPHGDPIPDEHGIINEKPQALLLEVPVQSTGLVVTVKDTGKAFLQYLDKIGLQIGTKIRVLEKVEYDQSMEILIDGKKQVYISKQVAENLLISE